MGGETAARVSTGTTPARPNDQMNEILMSLTSLEPKPIAELSAPEARKQPSPVDAVKARLKKEGKRTTPEPVDRVVNRAIPTYDASPRALANLANAVVVSTHYRQAPGHKFPAAHQDSVAAYKWTLANAKSLKGDPKRVAVAGESAGGNLR
ncbi:MAG: alpha/beta hydrolase fold domain-containing protein [Gemmatimonadales bacterium]|nr:alpha/beta hydrolase fold domain-containing protein [Gemmatimonadales bacterium]